MHLYVHATLFKTAKIQKQPKCPSMGKDVTHTHTYTMEYYSAIKR